MCVYMYIYYYWVGEGVNLNTVRTINNRNTKKKDHTCNTKISSDETKKKSNKST